MKKTDIWANIKSIFEDICKHSDRDFNITAKMFIDYIGKGRSSAVSKTSQMNGQSPKRKVFCSI